MKNKLSIGQMARLKNVSVKTLRYYDKLGLIKPIGMDVGTGYRYYSAEQSKQLDIILYMKMMGVPLKDIKEQLENRSLNDFISVVENVRQITHEKINVLKRIEKGMYSRMWSFGSTKEEEYIGKPYFERLSPHNIIYINKKMNSFKEIEIELRQLTSYYERVAPIVIGNVGYLKNIENHDHQKNTYEGIFLIVNQPLHRNVDLLAEVAEGDFAFIRWRDDTGDEQKYIDKLLRFIKVHNYQTDGPLYVRKNVDGIISNQTIEMRVKITPLTIC